MNRAASLDPAADTALSDNTATAKTTPARVVFWGTYDLSKPRTRILRDGLAELGVEVVEIHADIWPRHADKSRLSKAAIMLALLRALVCYPVLIFRYLAAPRHDAVIVPYLGQFDVLVLWPFARLRRRPVVWDMFLSLYDTVVNDRKMAAGTSATGRALKAIEWLACRAADRVLLDTRAHAAHISRLFALPLGKADAVPVGAEPGAFARLPAPVAHDGPAKVLFYGQLIPLHGVETILAAALSDRGRTRHWHIIGTGQDRPLLETALSGNQAPHVTWDDWVPYDRLSDAIARADICLGIFGASEKAASVVPNKVYQALLAGRSVITRQSPALHEVFPDADPGLRLVPHSDPDALLDAIEALEAAGYPVMAEEKLALAHPKDIASALCRMLTPMIESR